MILPALVTKELEREAQKLQEEANETFGEATGAMRMILGLAIGTLVDAGGVPATITYVTRILSFYRRVDDETPPAPAPPPAS